MKQLFLLSIIALTLFSCSKDDSVLPNDENCQLTFYGVARTLPTAYNEIYNYTHYKDSIVGTYQYEADSRKIKYVFNDNENTIYTETREISANTLVSYGTYYLDEQGLIDSFIRRNGSTDVINYRGIITRNANNQVVREISSYITYGHDRRFFYDENGDYSYGIEIGQGTSTYNDSIVYTLDMTKPNNGSPEYMLDDLNGKTSAHHVTRKVSIDRATLVVRQERRYTISPLDADGNLTFVKYEFENWPTDTFEADYSYDRTYGYSCQ
ncbi:MAG: hypothetical protein R2753_05040 [Chitinophagales bacterium]